MATYAVRFAKRVFDVAGALLGGALVLPLLPAVALAVRLDSPGPVLFRQRRVAGLRDTRAEGDARYRTFTLLKFRTMCDDAERTTGPVLAAKDDPRITRVGRFLRKTRLDELPQLWNVACGDMSLVGPRPERPEVLEDVARSVPFFEERLRAKPGLTGPAQVHLAYTGAIPEWSLLWGLGASLEEATARAGAKAALQDDLRAKLLYDLAYVAALESFSTFVSAELRVLLRTPLVMVRKLGE